MPLRSLRFPSPPLQGANVTVDVNLQARWIATLTTLLARQCTSAVVIFCTVQITRSVRQMGKWLAVAILHWLLDRKIPIFAIPKRRILWIFLAIRKESSSWRARKVDRMWLLTRSFKKNYRIPQQSQTVIKSCQFRNLLRNFNHNFPIMFNFGKKNDPDLFSIQPVSPQIEGSLLVATSDTAKWRPGRKRISLRFIWGKHVLG